MWHSCVWLLAIFHRNNLQGQGYISSCGGGSTVEFFFENWRWLRNIWGPPRLQRGCVDWLVWPPKNKQHRTTNAVTSSERSRHGDWGRRLSEDSAIVMGESCRKNVFKREKIRWNLLVGSGSGIKCIIQYNCKFVSALIFSVQAMGIYFFGYTRGTRKECFDRAPSPL